MVQSKDNDKSLNKWIRVIQKHMHIVDLNGQVSLNKNERCLKIHC